MGEPSVHTSFIGICDHTTDDDEAEYFCHEVFVSEDDITHPIGLACYGDDEQFTLWFTERQSEQIGIALEAAEAMRETWRESVFDDHRRDRSVELIANGAQLAIDGYKVPSAVTLELIGLMNADMADFETTQ